MTCTYDTYKLIISLMRHDLWHSWSFFKLIPYVSRLTFEGADYRMSCFYNFRDRSNKSTRWLCFQKKASSFQIHKSIYMHSHACLQLGKGCKFAIWISHSTQPYMKSLCNAWSIICIPQENSMNIPPCWKYIRVEAYYDGPINAENWKAEDKQKLVYTALKCMLIALHIFSYILLSNLLWIIWERKLQAIIFLEAYK